MVFTPCKEWRERNISVSASVVFNFSHLKVSLTTYVLQIKDRIYNLREREEIRGKKKSEISDAISLNELINL